MTRNKAINKANELFPQYQWDMATEYVTDPMWEIPVWSVMTSHNGEMLANISTVSGILLQVIDRSS